MRSSLGNRPVPPLTQFILSSSSPEIPSPRPGRRLLLLLGGGGAPHLGMEQYGVQAPGPPGGSHRLCSRRCRDHSPSWHPSEELMVKGTNKVFPGRGQDSSLPGAEGPVCILAAHTSSADSP